MTLLTYHFRSPKYRTILFNLIPLLLVLLLGLSANNKVYYLEYMLPLTSLFYLNAFYFYPKLRLKSRAITFSLLLILVSFCFLCFSIWSSLAHIFPASYPLTFREILSSPFPYHPFKREALLTLLTVFSISSAYAYIRNLISTKRVQRLKKIGLYSAVLALGILFSIVLKYYIDVSWKGSPGIQFMDSKDYRNLDEILQLPQFQNQWVYVDLWYSSCGPCRFEFKHLPKLKERLENKSIQYLYLTHDTSRPNDLQLWKNAIRKYELTGFHLFMSPDFDADIWSDIGSKTGISARYPHYLLIDEKGEIASYDAPRPSDLDKLLSLMDK